MNAPRATSADPTLSPLPGLLPELEALYTDIHAHPELSMQEDRTSSLAADRLRAAGCEVTTGIGKTGVVGLLRNGQGPTVMLRADMDALPVEEATDLPYASKETRAPFPEAFSGPLQYGSGIKAYALNLLIAQMISLKRVQHSIHALIPGPHRPGNLRGHDLEVRAAAASGARALGETGDRSDPSPAGNACR